MARPGRGLCGTLGAKRNGNGLSLGYGAGNIDHKGSTAYTTLVSAALSLSVVVIAFLFHSYIAVLVLILVLALSLLAPILCCFCSR